MNIKLKVCGMRNPGNILEVAALQPDYMGFIFYPKSKRFVGGDFVIPATLHPEINRVGVFVNEETNLILKLVAEHGLKYVQLHGDESPEMTETLKRNGVRIIKVFSVGAGFNFETTKPYQDFSDFFLFDTKSESYGGSGSAFDWNLLMDYDQQIPFFLSGGISLDNIEKVKLLTGMNLHAIDINSGAETAPGLKDIAKIKSILKILDSNS